MSDEAKVADGTTTPAPTPTTTATVAATPPPPDLGKLVEAAVAKHGDQTAALKAFAADLYAARDDLKAARAELPPRGAKVIAGDDLKHFEAYRELGTPAEVRKTREERDALAAEVGQYKAEKLHAQAASLAGFNPAVLHRLAVQDRAEIVIVDAKDKTGKDVKVPHVKGEGDKTTPLAEYAAKHWSDFLPSLKPGGDSLTPRPLPTATRADTLNFTPVAQRTANAAPPDAKAKYLAGASNRF